MKFGVREICNVVLKAKAAQKVGKKIFYKNEPVMYFDTLKTSSMEGQSSTVYAQGGRGKDLVHFFNEDGLGAIVNSSRGIIAAYQQEKYASYGEANFAGASRAAVEDMLEDIRGALK